MTALTIDGGTFGVAGVTYNINDTQAGTTTTITGGPHLNAYNLSNLGEAGGLDNLPGPVVIHGGGAGDAVAADDFDNAANYDYTVTDTTVTSDRPLRRLDLRRARSGGALSLYGSNGSNTINVDSTANGVSTKVYGDQGVDTINVNGTGTGSTLGILSGDSTNDASTVNVLANSEAVEYLKLCQLPHHHHGQHRLDGRPGDDGQHPGPDSRL